MNMNYYIILCDYWWNLSLCLHLFFNIFALTCCEEQIISALSLWSHFRDDEVCSAPSSLSYWSCSCSKGREWWGYDHSYYQCDNRIISLTHLLSTDVVFSHGLFLTHFLTSVSPMTGRSMINIVHASSSDQSYNVISIDQHSDWHCTDSHLWNSSNQHKNIWVLHP